MTAPYDDTEFIDRDFQNSKEAAATATLSTPAGVGPGRPPSRQQLEVQLGATQQQIAELRRLQEELERERANIEETRRRRAEFETGRTEVIDNLTRGIGLLEKAEFEARRQAEQMRRTLDAFRESLESVQAIHEENWTESTLAADLTAALTTIDNARMEWNAARLKWTLLDGTSAAAGPDSPAAAGSAPERLGFWTLCRMGLAVSLPLAILGLALIALLIALLLR